LADYDDTQGLGRQGLLDMPQKQHWHPKMMWYGPCGIGTTRGLEGFVDHHQLPFRTAFPNRKAGHHYLRIGDGPYSVTGGWPSIRAQHLGGNFLGTSPTGGEVTMRVMDFYLHHEGLIRENWVPIDIIHLLLQMDIDIFARMQSFFRRGA
jgi:predicted ester cyclase